LPSSTTTHGIDLDDSNQSSVFRPPQDNSATEPEDIQARLLVGSGAYEGPAGNSKRRKLQENSSIPGNPPSSTDDQAKRVDQADPNIQAGLRVGLGAAFPTRKKLSHQVSPPKRHFVTSIAKMIVLESPKDNIRKPTIENPPGSINTMIYLQGGESAENGTSMVATRSTLLPQLLGQESATGEFGATVGEAPQAQNLVQDVHLSCPPKSKTKVPIFIITPGSPLIEQLWPEGKMLGTTLLAFVEGISNVKQLNHGDIEKIELTLRTTVMSVCDTKITIFQGNEDLWKFAKDVFKDRMKEAMKEAKAKKVKACFRILVKPYYEEEEFEF
jgi:hypothetical protein